MRNNKEHEKRKSKVEIVLFLLFTYTLFMFFFMLSNRGSSLLEYDEYADTIGIFGEMKLDDDTEYQPYLETSKMLFSKAKSICIKGKLRKPIEENETIFFYVEGLDVQMYINGKMVYDNNDEVDITWDSFRAPKIRATDEVELHLRMRNEKSINVYFNRFLNNKYVGTRYGVLVKILSKNWVFILIDWIILFLGGEIFVHWVEIRRSKVSEDTGILSGALTVMLGAIGGFIDRAYIGLFTSNYLLIRNVDIIVQMLTAVAMMIYLRRYVKNEKNRDITRYINILMILLLCGFMMYEVFVARDLASAARIEIASAMFAVTIAFLISIHFVFVDRPFESKETRGVIDSLLILVFAVIIEMIYYIITGTYLVYLFRTAMLIFAIVQRFIIGHITTNQYRLAVKTKELEAELTNSQVQIMLSQIQPHFLYNALGTIRALCVRDPEEARNAIDYFSKYLRANMNSLSEQETISFEKELDHVKSYLYIEHLRFEDLLNVQYDIKAMDFNIPPLTMQTLVENAVRHGLLAKEEGGTLKISSYEKDDNYFVLIEDDGVGFDTDNLNYIDERAHLGTTNTIKRLETICNGKLILESQIGKGTRATIIIPKATEEAER